MIPFAGGNYFRQFPKRLSNGQSGTGADRSPIRWLFIFGFGTLDPGQPRINTGSFVRAFRHYRNSERMVRMITGLTGRYRFTSIAGFLGHTQEPITTTNTITLQSAATVSPPPPSVASPIRPVIPVSVIIPCFNEDESIAYLVRALDELKTRTGR